MSDLLDESSKLREDRLNVIANRRDMIFKREDSGKVVDVKFIGFDTIVYASPALDVLELIYSSGSVNEEAWSRQRELLEMYLQTFNSCLESL